MKFLFRKILAAGLFSLCLLFFLVFSVFAEHIILTNDKVVEGTIVEAGNGYIKVDQGVGMPVTYYCDQIASPSEICQSGPATSHAQQSQPAQSQRTAIPSETKQTGSSVGRIESHVPLKILFFGNSLTSGMNQVFDALVKASPFATSEFTYVVPGGWTLRQHLESAQTENALKTKRWDYVVLRSRASGLWSIVMISSNPHRP